MKITFRLPAELHKEIMELLRYGTTLGVSREFMMNQIVGLGLPHASARLRGARKRNIPIPTRLPVSGKPMPRSVHNIEEKLVCKAQELADEYETSRGLVFCWACEHGWKPGGRWVEENGYNQRTLFLDNMETNRYRYSRTPQKDRSR